MTKQHPITPPPELVGQWAEKAENWEGAYEADIATQAARWGADQELEACCDSLQELWAPSDWITSLRAKRRPKPPSLKEQALVILDDLRSIDATHYNILRNALEQLND